MQQDLASGPLGSLPVAPGLPSCGSQLWYWGVRVIPHGPMVRQHWFNEDSRCLFCQVLEVTGRVGVGATSMAKEYNIDKP